MAETTESFSIKSPNLNASLFHFVTYFMLLENEMLFPSRRDSVLILFFFLFLSEIHGLLGA